MANPDREREKSTPQEEEGKAEDRRLFSLGIGGAMNREESHRRPAQTGRYDTRKTFSDDAEEESYWFSTFLESSVRDHEVYEQEKKEAPTEEGADEEPFTRALASDEDLLVTSIKSLTLFEQAGQALESTFSNLKDNRPVEHLVLEELARKIVSNVVILPPDSYDLRSPLFQDTLYYHLLKSFGKPYDFVEHSLQVAILSVVFAKESGASKDGLIRLCLAALLHEVGMLFLPTTVWDHSRSLTEREKATIRYHAEFGQELVSKLEGALPDTATTLGQEHERADGSGYPLGLKSHEIEDLAKVIGLVDVFDALTHGRPHRPPCSPHQALKIILTEMREAFDYELLKAFLNLITVFPLGSYVELTTGEAARVVWVNSRNPLRPTVEVVGDAEGRPLPEPYPLELWSEAEVSVSRCIDDFYLPPEG
jgi:HD-GYP domain-containing protein (c-di-GMP phosphodiesterase class II)